jgi:colicin import membrane protein
MPKNPASEPRLMWGLVISSALHLMLITVLVGVPSWYRPERTYFSSAYRVSLVDMPGSGPGGGKGGPGAGEAAKKVAVSEVQPKPAAPPAPVKKEPVEKPAVEAKKSGVTITATDGKKSVSSAAAKKTKAANAEKEYSTALSKIRDKVGEQRREEALARIRENLAGGGGSGEAAGAGGPGTGPGGGGGGIGPGGGRIANLPLNYRFYYQAIEQKIKSNWNLALPRGILEDMRGMEVVLGITIASDGEITDVSFEQKTGNVYLDDSAYRAVKKSSPLPPFADYNIRESSFETGIVFPVGELLE